MSAAEGLIPAGGMAGLYLLSLPAAQPFFTPLGLGIATVLTVGPLFVVLIRIAVTSQPRREGNLLAGPASANRPENSPLSLRTLTQEMP
jgi:hypothetical protein